MAGKKWLIVVLGVLNVLALAGIVFWYINRDDIPPVITRGEEIVYEETMNNDELLQGVTAVDETDGDVSHTLVVEKVTVNQSSGNAVVTYGAMDRAGNISKQSFQMEMKVIEQKEVVENVTANSANEVFTLEAGEAVINANTSDENMTEDDSKETTGGELTEESSDETEETEDDEDSEEVQDEEGAGEENAVQQEQPRQNTAQAPEQQVNPEEIPAINFSATEVVTKKGYNPAWVTVISQMYDNKDTYQYLLQHLVIHGEFNNAEVGAYDVSVSTVDSDGYESEAKAIRIIVEE